VGSIIVFANPSADPARMLILVTPGGFERYFEALAEVVRATGGFPPPQELAAMSLAHGSVPVSQTPLTNY
jgi:hypothetical protein